MATATKAKPVSATETPADKNGDTMLEAAKATGLVNVETLPDLANDLGTLDPKAVKTMTEDVLGKQLIIVRVALHDSTLTPDKTAETDEATDNTPREYASIEFYLAGDPTLRFLTTGAGRLVPVVRNMIATGYKLPVKATIVQSRTPKGVRYFHFAGKDAAK